MSNALDAFRAQREAAAAIHAQLSATAALLSSIHKETQVLAHTESLRKLLQEESAWLGRAERAIETMRHHREWEVYRFWPAVWRRWVVAVVSAVLTAGAAGAGYVWAARPGEDERSALRARLTQLDSVAARVLTMTPAERRQFDALMKRPALPK